MKQERAAARLFAEITSPETAEIADARVRGFLIRLGHLNNDILAPYLLQVFAKARDGELSTDDLVAVLKVLLAYLAFHRDPDNGVESTFCSFKSAG